MSGERWAVIGDSLANLHVVQADAPHLRVCFLTSNGPTEERARLIAAAPEQNEALREFVEWADGAENGWACPAALETKMRAAILKAEGK